MKPFVDTNWLVATYFENQDAKRTEMVERLLSRIDAPCFLSKPVLLESEALFAHLSRQPASDQWQKLQADIGTSLQIADISWDVLEAGTLTLIRRFAHRARIAIPDLMIVAAALKAEATHFLSFDTNSNLRALAAVLKLKVFPELTVDDKRRVAALR